MRTLVARRPYVYMQDGARAHTAKLTVDYLRSEVHPLLSLSLGWQGVPLIGPKEWPAKSADLNILDSFGWPEVTRRVYRTPVKGREELMQRIRTACAEVEMTAIRKAISGVPARARWVIQHGGRAYDDEV